MGNNQRQHSKGKHVHNHVSEEVSAENCTDSDTQEYEVSADLYSQRARSRANIRKGDWWVAVGLYLILFGIAFVVF